MLEWVLGVFDLLEVLDIPSLALLLGEHAVSLLLPLLDVLLLHGELAFYLILCLVILICLVLRDIWKWRSKS